MNRIVIALAMFALLGGCKKDDGSGSGSGLGEALAAMSGFADAMCQCRDKACADSVQERMTKWAIDVAANKEWANRKPDEATMKKMTEHGEKYASCMTKAMAPAPEPSPPPPAPEKPALPAAVTSPATVEALLASARTWARGEHEGLHIVQLDIWFVGAEGVVDPEFGRVAIELGRATSSDDPKRRTGAPVAPSASQPTKCVELAWTAKGWTKLPLGACRNALAPFPRCPVATIWKRAIDKGAPADALAMLVLREGANRQWTFSISDELRKVAVTHYIDDDCEVVVEKQ